MISNPKENPILQRLLDIMAERSLTAKKVTEDCNMSASSFTDWKKGKASPGVEAISKLSAYFDVSTDYLIKGVEYKDRFNLEDGSRVRSYYSGFRTER